MGAKVAKVSQKPKLGYWGVKGRGQQIRLFLTWMKVDFEDIRYGGPNAPDWFKEAKFSLGLDFPNLPYFIDEQQKVTESLAVFKYIAHKYKHKETLGKTWQESVLLDTIFGVVEDCHTELSKLVYSTDDKAAYEKLFQDSKFAQKLAQLDKYIGNKNTLLGYLTFSDFHLFGLLDVCTIATTNLFGESYIKKRYQGLEAAYQNIKRLGAEFLSRPENQLPFLPPNLCKINLMKQC